MNLMTGRWEYAARAIVVLLVISALVPLYYGLKTPYFSHDDIGYIGNYLGKLHGEGRWINHLIFRTARQVPEPTAYLICWLGFFTFLTVVYGKILNSWWLAVGAAALTMHHPGMYDLFSWPVTIAPTSAVLAVAAVCSLRLSHRIVMPLFGVILMGMYQGIFYLLPLLYISDARNLRTTAEIILVWGASFVGGYVAALLVTAQYTGVFGLTIEEWRQANPLSDLPSLLVNLASRWSFFVRDIELAFPGILVWGLTASVALWALAIFQKPKLIWPTLVALGVVACHYVITVLNGIYIHPRTTFHIFTAIAVFAAVAAAQHRAGMAAALVAVLPASLLLWSYSVQNVRWFQEVTATTYADIQAAADVHGQPAILDFRHAEDYWSSVRARISGEPIDGYFETRYQPHRVLPALRNLGASSRVACPTRNNGDISEYCLDYLPEAPPQCLQPMCAEPVGDSIVLRVTGSSSSGSLALTE